MEEGEGEGERWTCSYALALASSVGVRVSVGAEEKSMLGEERSVIGGLSEGDARIDAASRKLSSVDADVEAWFDRVSVASGSEFVIVAAACFAVGVGGRGQKVEEDDQLADADMSIAQFVNRFRGKCVLAE